MKSVQFAFALGATFFGTSCLLYYLHKRRKRNCPPKDGWKYAGTLEEIIMYPLKSCGGIELNEAYCDKSGLKCAGLEDRIFYLFNEDDQMLYAGVCPEMWKIQSKLVGVDELEVTAPGMEPLILNIYKLTNGRREVIKRLGRSVIRLVECESKYGNWFAKFLLGKDTGLTLFVCLNLRKIPFRKNVDLNPYMVLFDESIKDLNDRIPNKVHHWQFRGNFLINTRLPAFTEDNWKWMRIGNDAIFRYKAPCYRCILINVNPFTCERSKDFEPLRTLKKYRMNPGKIEPEMGIYFNLFKEGAVKLGDDVFFIT